uniref:Putative salp15 n=1 Tax=Ixodes ricinus TaxID=34613 RepID=A0A0K8RBA5_IXORI
MKNTGLSFFIVGTTRLIVAMFVLFAICKPTVTGVTIKYAQNLAPSCEKKIENLCNNQTAGTLEEVQVNSRICQATCIYKPDPTKDTRFQGGMLIWERNYDDVRLPNGMPCAFSATCQDGKCSCKFCDKDGSPKAPR